MNLTHHVTAMLSKLIVITACLLWVLIPHDAAAQLVGGFSCSGGNAVGSLYDTGAGVCPTTMKFSNVFTFLLCHTEQLSANLLGSMYCGVMRGLQPAVIAMVTLAVLFASIGFTFGFTNVSAKDYTGLLLKIAVVFGFATQADLIIDVGYSLLVSGLREGTAIAIGSLYTANGAAAPKDALSVYALMDGFLAQALHFATDAVGQQWEAGQNPCKNAIFAVMAVMAVAFPPIFYIGILIIGRIGMSFVRGIFGYMYSIIGITFLLTLAPFFFSFFLFKQTSFLFDKWLGYLVSFSLQLVIVFAFLSFVLSIKVDHITSSLTDVIMPATQTLEGNTFRAPWKYCTLCEFDVVDKETGAVLTDNSADFLTRGKLQCRTPKRAIPITETLAPPTPAAGSPAPTSAASQFQNTLMRFAMTGLMSLLVLAYVVDALLGRIPVIAQALASALGGAIYAPQLVRGDQQGGVGAQIDIPGGRIADTIERGFTDGYNTRSDAITAAVEGFKTATRRLVTGGRGASDEAGGTGTNDPGLLGHFRDYMINPQRNSGE